MYQIPDSFKKLLFNKESHEPLTTEEQQAWDEYETWEQELDEPVTIDDTGVEQLLTLHFTLQDGKQKGWEKFRAALPPISIIDPAPVAAIENYQQKARLLGTKMVAAVIGLVAFSLVLARSGQPDLYATEYLVKETGSSDTSGVTLPDGSRVALNFGSTLRYPRVFTGNERHVELTGEAYFEIRTDANHPFRVTTYLNDVIATGTRFNIQAYAKDSMVRTTLLQGIVFVKKDGQPVTMTPGQQLIQKEEGPIIRRSVSSNNALAWQKRQIALENEDLLSVMQQIRRYYDVDYAILGNPSMARLRGYPTANQPLDTLLNSLENLVMIEFKHEGNIIIVNERKN